VDGAAEAPAAEVAADEVTAPAVESAALETGPEPPAAEEAVEQVAERIIESVPIAAAEEAPAAELVAQSAGVGVATADPVQQPPAEGAVSISAEVPAEPVVSDAGDSARETAAAMQPSNETPIAEPATEPVVVPANTAETVVSASVPAVAENPGAAAAPPEPVDKTPPLPGPTVAVWSDPPPRSADLPQRIPIDLSAAAPAFAQPAAFSPREVMLAALFLFILFVAVFFALR
jgi:hypothetical protein